MAVVEGGGGRRAPRGRAPGFPGSPHAPPKPPVPATCSHEEGDRVARLGKAGSCRAPARSWGRSWGRPLALPCGPQGCPRARHRLGDRDEDGPLVRARSRRRGGPAGRRGNVGPMAPRAVNDEVGGRSRSEAHDGALNGRPGEGAEAARGGRGAGGGPVESPSEELLTEQTPEPASPSSRRPGPGVEDEQAPGGRWPGRPAAGRCCREAAAGRELSL